MYEGLVEGVFTKGTPALALAPCVLCMYSYSYCYFTFFHFFSDRSFLFTLHTSKTIVPSVL